MTDREIIRQTISEKAESEATSVTGWTRTI